MTEWKIRQEIYHRLKKDHDDDLSKYKIEFTKDIVKQAIRYFRETDIGWIYPSKSYMVGICYSRWLSENFGGNPLDYLNDNELLYNNDPYFKTYSEDFEIYDSILKEIGKWEFDVNLGMVPDVKNYFVEEFMINE